MQRLIQTQKIHWDKYTMCLCTTLNDGTQYTRALTEAEKRDWAIFYPPGAEYFTVKECKQYHEPFTEYGNLIQTTNSDATDKATVL